MRVIVPHFPPASEKSPIQINALFLQPTFDCKLSCPGCYVKGGEEKRGASKEEYYNRRLYSNLEYILLNLLNPINAPIIANQVTVALDTGVPTLTKAMRGTSAVNFSNRHRSDTELHLTTQSLSWLIKEIAAARGYFLSNTYTLDRAFSEINMITLSSYNSAVREQLPEVKKNFPQASWNYNFQLDHHRVADAKKHLLLALKSFDTVYCVLHKPDVGEYLSSGFVQSFMKTFQELKKDPELKDRIFLDGCVSDSKRWLGGGGGCSAGIGNFQVWPDLSVTGCPYKQTPESSPYQLEEETSVIDIIGRHIREAHQHYAFNDCKIKNAIDPENSRILLEEEPDLYVLGG